MMFSGTYSVRVWEDGLEKMEKFELSVVDNGDSWCLVSTASML